MKQYCYKNFYIATLCTILQLCANAQQKNDTEIISSIKNYTIAINKTLSANPAIDSLASYLQTQFNIIGTADSNQRVLPYATNFGRKINLASTFLYINERELALNEDYFPLVFSGTQAHKLLPV